MAGKAYQLPRPKPDVQPKHAGADNVGYEEGLRPRPRYAQSNATDTWKNATESVTAELHCNIQPRISIAGTLDADGARALGVGPYIPGRVPAPRIQRGCAALDAELDEPSGANARDLMTRSSQFSPFNPDGGPRSGPPPKPRGLDPLPKPLPAPTPPKPPVTTKPTTPPSSPPIATTPATPEPYFSPRVPGTLEAINFHLTGDIAAGAAASELRVYGPVGVPFIIKQLWINTDSGAAPGQFLDVLISQDGDTTDTATPSGTSIFPLLDGVGNIPDPDKERGVAIPVTDLNLNLSHRIDHGDRWIKVRQYFIAPAAALANLHVTIIIERMDAPGMMPPPLKKRKPLIPKTETPTAPPIEPTPTPVPTAAFMPDPNERPDGTAPAWRVAAQGLARTQLNLQRGLSAQIDAYGAWLQTPNAETAAPFRARIEKVLNLAGMPEGNANTYVSLAFALDPFEA